MHPREVDGFSKPRGGIDGQTFSDKTALWVVFMSADGEESTGRSLYKNSITVCGPPFLKKLFLLNDEPPATPGIVHMHPLLAESKNDHCMNLAFPLSDQQCANEGDWEHSARNLVFQIEEIHAVLLGLKAKGPSGFY